MTVGVNFWRYGFVVLALLVGTGGLVAAFGRSKMRVRGDAHRRSIWNYILVWPLLFGSASSKNKKQRDGRLLTNRELVGWLVVAVLLVLAMTFHWSC